MPAPSRGFTLIELLVVVAIIEDPRIVAIPQQSDSDIANWTAAPTVFTNVPAR